MLRAVMPVVRESSSIVTQSASVGSVTQRAYPDSCRIVTCNMSDAMVLLELAAPFAAAAAQPAGGAASHEVIGASAAAGVLSLLLAWLVLGHRSGRRPELARAADR